MLIAATVIATLVFPFIPRHSDVAIVAMRGTIVTFAVAIASIWAPTFFYAGLRTRCTFDWVVGLIGMLTLLFWIPCLIYEW